MDVNHNIYELTEYEQRLVKEGLPPDDGKGDDFDEAQVARLREDVARLDGYLKGRADSDARRLGQGRGLASGAGSNKDLAG